MPTAALEPSRRRLWAAVAGLSMDQLVAWGALYYSYTVLAAPLARDLGLSRQVVGAAFSATLLVSCLAARRVGRALDRTGARPVLLAGAMVGPLALGLLAAVRQEISLLAAFAALGLAHALSLYEPAFRAIVDLFTVERERSRALVAITCVGGLASTAFLPLTAFLVGRFGWRTALLWLAFLVAAVTLPARLTLPARGAAAVEPDPGWRRPPAGPGAASRWLGAGFAVQAFATTGATLCLVWQQVERGASLQSAALVAGLAGAAQVPGRLLLAPLQRTLRTKWRVPLLMVVQATALAAIAVASGPLLGVAVILFGAASGVMTLERPAVVLELYGRETYGARSGELASLALLARAGAPFAVEALHGSTRYAGVMAILAASLLLAGLLIAAAYRERSGCRQPRGASSEARAPPPADHPARSLSPRAL